MAKIGRLALGPRMPRKVDSQLELLRSTILLDPVLV